MSDSRNDEKVGIANIQDIALDPGALKFTDKPHQTHK